MCIQRSFDMSVAVKSRCVTPAKRVKRADEFKAMPLSDKQLTWAIGHNLTWVLSIVKPESGVQS